MPGRRPARLIALTLLLSAWTVTASDTRVYRHTDLDIEFRAEAGWTRVPRPGDPGTCEWVDPDGVHVLLWMTSTEMDTDRYLGKMVDMMDIEADGPRETRMIDRREARVVRASGRIGDVKARSLLAVIPSGPCLERPRETELHVVQVWRPQADATSADQMSRLLEGVRIGDRLILGSRTERLYPDTRKDGFGLPSPYAAPDGRTYVTVLDGNGRHGMVDATVENGTANDYPGGAWGKGRQLHVDAEDFPGLAADGLHDETDLATLRSITGRPLADITRDARPGAASRAGFIAAEEDILSVIRGDDRLVSGLGLTHPRLAAPLFEVLNLIVRDLELSRRERTSFRNIVGFLYGGREIALDFEGGKGWQDSIFEDDVLGYWRIWISREPDPDERDYLESRYGDRDDVDLTDLEKRLFSLHTGEMVPFYIQRYGFYEGHTSFRADPIAITLIFGLMTLEEVDRRVGGDLPGVLSHLYTKE